MQQAKIPAQTAQPKIQDANLAYGMKEILSESDIALPQKGEVIKGEVISIGKNSVLIDLGPLGTGIVYPKEFYDNPTVQKELKPGVKVSAMFLEIENEEGYRELSLKQAQMTTAWQDIKEKKDNNEVIITKITNINKGGLMVEVNGIQGFLPLSQLGPEHYPKVDGGDVSKIVQILQSYKGYDFNVKILDYNEAENRLIVSERAVLNEKIKEELENFKVGDVVDGEITDITDFGAFIKLTDNIEGLIHISEMDWKIIDDPREVLSAGEKVKAKIMRVDGDKISLSLKELKPDPWVDIEKKYQVGQTVRGEIVKITNYGALVKLNESLIGLILKSEFGDKSPGEAVQPGKKYDLAVINIDPKEHKMLLTLNKKQDTKEKKSNTKTKEESNGENNNQN